MNGSTEERRLDSIRQVLRDAMEAELEARDPVAAYDRAEIAAYKAAGVSRDAH